MNFAEASGYLQNAGRKKAWEAVCIGFDSPHQQEGSAATTSSLSPGSGGPDSSSIFC